MTQEQLNPYLTRLKIARSKWINANPRNIQQVNETWKQYQIALTNYRNVKGV